jgi:kexin
VLKLHQIKKLEFVMNKFIKISAIVSTVLLISGCDFLESTPSKKAPVVNYEDNITKTKEFTVKEGSYDTLLDIGTDIEYIKKLDGLNSSLFSASQNTLKLNVAPIYGKSNEYKAKLYVVNSNKEDYILLIKVQIIKDTSDNNNTNGGDNNNTTTLDSDNDYIPDSIEKLLGKDSNNSDEDGNGIADGLDGDPFLDKEWYIKADGTPTNPSEVESVVGNDLDLFDVYKKYMGYNNGNPIVLQIVDSGVDVAHEDLKDNIDLSRSLNSDTQGEPIPGGFFRTHGTMLAGIAAARAFNGIGVRGVAPFAKIAGSNWLVRQSLDGLEAAWLSGNGANEIAVTNNSWGRYYTIDSFYEDIMQEGTKTLRDGKGRIYVFASGNARADSADSNIQYVLNNQFALVVGALTVENKVAPYSTAGANVWISAYGGDADYNNGPTIATTYISGESTKTWEKDTKKNYTYAMAGSSAASPMVTGAVALLLEACPNLGWRDVKYILAKSAKQVDSDNSSWVTNSANLHFSRDYGFGLIDTKSAIQMCENNYTNLGAQQILESSREFTNVEVSGSKSVTINIDSNHKVEWVEATVDLDTQSASSFDIYLTSPSGTKVQLVKHGTKVDSAHIPNGDWMSGGFRFSTGAHLDEDSIGNWQVEIVDSNNSSAKLNSVELKIYAH